MRKLIFVHESDAVNYNNVIEKSRIHSDKSISYYISHGGGNIYHAIHMIRVMRNYLGASDFIDFDILSSAGIFYSSLPHEKNEAFVQYELHPLMTWLDDKFICKNRDFVRYTDQRNIDEARLHLNDEDFGNFFYLYNLLSKFSLMVYDHFESIGLSEEQIRTIVSWTVTLPLSEVKQSSVNDLAILYIREATKHANSLYLSDILAARGRKISENK